MLIDLVLLCGTDLAPCVTLSCLVHINSAHLRGHEAPLRQLLQLVPAPLQVAHKVAVKARLLRGWGGVGGVGEQVRGDDGCYMGGWAQHKAA